MIWLSNNLKDLCVYSIIIGIKFICFNLDQIWETSWVWSNSSKFLINRKREGS